MEVSQFWEALQPLLLQLPHIPSNFWESIRNYPSLPIQLIEKTVCQRAVYLSSESPLHLLRITPHLPLSASQQLALQICLANSPLVVIQGASGSGKTRLSQVLAQGLIEQQKRILILTNHSETLSAYETLPKIPFRLSQPQDYAIWLRKQLLRQDRGKVSMDFLPVHLLPDSLLVQLRSPRKLEKWLSILRNPQQSNDIKSILKTEFPEWSSARLNLLAYRLQKLLPLLQQQLWLHQQSARLSEEALITLATQIEQESAIPIVGTVSNFLQPRHQPLWEMSFDCVIVEDAEYLSWGEFIFLSSITQKLILLGNLPLNSVFPNRISFYKSSPLFWLGEFLLPAYRYQLSEQFRLHSSLAQPIFKTLYRQWIWTQPRSDILTLPQLTARLQWQDVRATPAQQENPWEGKRVLKLMSRLGAAQASQIGILAFTQAQRDWLCGNCPPEFREVLIGSFTDWIAKERRILLVSCVGYPEKLKAPDLAIALTRARDYLILFGDYSRWLTELSPLQSLLERRELQRQREVSLR